MFILLAFKKLVCILTKTRKVNCEHNSIINRVWSWENVKKDESRGVINGDKRTKKQRNQNKNQIES